MFFFWEKRIKNFFFIFKDIELLVHVFDVYLMTYQIRFKKNSIRKGIFQQVSPR